MVVTKHCTSKSASMEESYNVLKYFIFLTGVSYKMLIIEVVSTKMSNYIKNNTTRFLPPQTSKSTTITTILVLQ